MKTPSLVLSLAFSLAMGGCAAVGTPMNDAAVPVQSADFMGQTQLPAGTKILYDQSLIIGSGDNQPVGFHQTRPQCNRRNARIQYAQRNLGHAHCDPEKCSSYLAEKIKIG